MRKGCSTCFTVSDEEHNAQVGATDETMWSRLGSLYHLPISVAEAIQLKKSLYIESLKQEIYIEPIPSVKQLIVNLYRNGFLLVLASSSPHSQIDYILERLELKSYFHSILSGEDVKAGKPHPEIFLKAAESVGAKPASCVVIEDSNNGVVAAKKAGMKCIGFLNPNSGSQDLNEVDRLIQSFGELSPTIVDVLF